MRLIAHRGNTDGVKLELENTPEYIFNALSSGFDVEIDVWGVEGELWLGHDKPQHKMIDLFNHFNYIADDRLWYHCKNLESITILNKQSGDAANFFWHQKDDFTLTSNGHIWTYQNKPITKNSICVLPEIGNYTEKELKCCYGICSDNIVKYNLYNI